jgi:ubiquitin
MIYYIYKIICNDVSITDFYIGSTTCFRRRKNEHKSRYNKLHNNKIYQIIRDNGGWDNWRMVIIEEIIDTTLIQARIREEYYRVEFGATLNSQSCYTGLTRKEYNKVKAKLYEKTEKRIEYLETNKEKKRAYQKEWSKANKDRIKEKRQLKNHFNKVMKELVNCYGY